MFFWLKVEFHVNKILEHPELYQKTPPREVKLQVLSSIFHIISTARTPDYLCMRVKDWDPIWDGIDALGEEKINVTDVDNDEGKQPGTWVSIPNSRVELPEGVCMDQL